MKNQIDIDSILERLLSVRGNKPRKDRRSKGRRNKISHRQINGHIQRTKDAYRIRSSIKSVR